jgi:enoyl-CoA hydratase
VTAAETNPLVRLERIETTVELTIDNPPVNVLSGAVLEALIDAVHRAEADPQARVILLRGAAERSFAAGANIREMSNLEPAAATLHAERGQLATTTLEDVPLPVIAAVHGSCLGGGTEIALACDFIVASEDAAFGQPEVNLGVMPGWGGTVRLPGRVGPAQARRWILLGESVPAPAALEQGLVDQVVPRSQLLGAARELARQLAAKSPTALAAAKYALNHALMPDRTRDLAYEREIWAQLFATSDQKEGMRAFLEKRRFLPGGRENWAAVSHRFPWAEPRRGSRAKRKNGDA